jgi:hypothetical protein
MERRLTELAHYKGSGPPPANKNAAARKLWWGVPGRTLVWVLDHIAVSKYPWLTMPMWHWLPRRMDGLVTSSSRSSSSMPSSNIVIGSPLSAPTRVLLPKKEPGSSAVSNARVKKEAASPASFARIKKEPGVMPASLACVKKEPGVISLARVKKEPGAPSSLKKAQRLAEDTAL